MTNGLTPSQFLLCLSAFLIVLIIGGCIWIGDQVDGPYAFSEPRDIVEDFGDEWWTGWRK